MMHTLLRHQHFQADHFRNDSLAFLAGYRGHSNALMKDFAKKAKRKLQDLELACDSNLAHSLVKVSAGNPCH